MHCYAQRVRHHAAMAAVVILFLAAATGATYAQTKQLLQWQSDLHYLRTLSSDDIAEQRATVVQIRKGVELWLKMHPDSKIELKAAADQPWGNEEARNQVVLLREALTAILAEGGERPFQLGVTEVSVTAEASPLSPLTDTLGRTEMANRQALTVANALDYLPGLALDRGAAKNETGIRLRGFTNKGQVPLFIDGIPIQVPYNGSLDFGRFLTSDVAEIQVAKGYSSPLMGPNGMGGSINLVTRQPEKKIEADATMGTGSGEQLLASLHLGSKFDHFYVQGSIDWLQQEFIPLSGDFPLQNFEYTGLPRSTYPKAYQTTRERNMSDSRDAKYSGRAGYTPRGEDQYVFTWINQKGEKGNPVYAGGLAPRPTPGREYEAPFLRFWQWPTWNKSSYYFISNTGLGEASSVKFRLFYDQFKNSINMFDNAAMNSMRGRSGGISIYDDHTSGMSWEFTNRSFSRNTFSASFFFKDDMHEEQTVNPQTGVNSALTSDRTQQFSIGMQDVIAFTQKFRATIGFSADYHRGMAASQEVNGVLRGFACTADPNNTAFDGCTPHIWNFNPQASVSYQLTQRDNVFVTFSDRGRFPTMMDSYSYRFGRALANPELKSEHSRNWDIGWSHTIGSRTQAQVEYFHNSIRDAIQSIWVIDPTYNPDIRNSASCRSSDRLGFCTQNVNAASQVHQGAEISIRSTPLTRLTLDASYTYINRSIDFGSASTTALNTLSLLPTIPRSKVVFNATAELPHKILGMATYRYEGGMVLQNTNYTVYGPEISRSHAVVDIGTVVPISAGFSLQTGVKNLFDRDYYYTYGYPEAGRNWYLNMRYRF